MSEYKILAKYSELELRKPFRVELSDDLAILIIKLEDGIYTINEMCTHSDYSLCDGPIDGCEIECPLHFAKFNIKTGEVTESPAFEDLKTYPTRIEGDNVLVLC